MAAAARVWRRHRSGGRSGGSVEPRRKCRHRCGRWWDYQCVRSRRHAGLFGTGAVRGGSSLPAGRKWLGRLRLRDARRSRGWRQHRIGWRDLDRRKSSDRRQLPRRPAERRKSGYRGQSHRWRYERRISDGRRREHVPVGCAMHGNRHLRRSERNLHVQQRHLAVLRERDRRERIRRQRHGRIRDGRRRGRRWRRRRVCAGDG